MKRIMMAAVALICMTISLVFFSACHSEKTTSTVMVNYSVTSSVVVTAGGDAMDKLVASGISGSYTTALQSAVGVNNSETADAKVIAACDAVYKSHSKYTHLKGTVTISRQEGDKAATVLKEYVYPYSE